MNIKNLINVPISLIYTLFDGSLSSKKLVYSRIKSAKIETILVKSAKK